MHRKHPRPQMIYLLPGQLLRTSQHHIVSTILGSCISLILHVPQSNFSVICHAIHPLHKDLFDVSYTDCATEYILQEILTRQLSPRQFQLKLFGGASAYSEKSNPALTSIGQKNLEIVREKLALAELFLTNEDTGGFRGRKLLFETRTGRVYIKKLQGHIHEFNS